MQWDTGIELLEKPTIKIKREVLNKIRAMSKEIAPNEWGGYLLGQDFFVYDIIVTKQEVTSTEWDSKERPENDNVIGTAHSHHTMGAFASGTDDEYILTTYPINIIYSFKDQVDTFLTFYTIDLPDGNKLKVEANLLIIDENITKWVKENKGKIEKKTYQYYKNPKQSRFDRLPKDQALDIYPKEDAHDDYYPITTDEEVAKQQYRLYGCDECGTKESGLIYYDEYGDMLLCDKCANGFELTDELQPCQVTEEDLAD